MKSTKLTIIQELKLFMSAFLCFVSLAIWLLCFTVSISIYSHLFIFGLVLIIWSLFSPSKRFCLSKWPGIISGLLLLITFFVQTNFTSVSPKGGNLSQTPKFSILSFVNKLFSEEDVVYIVSRIMPLIAGISFKEAENLIPKMELSYKEMRAEQGNFTSPLLYSLLWPQNSTNYQTLSFCNQDCKTSALIYLHGVGGNWSLLCWNISQAANKIQAKTVCPSLNALGTWSSNEGEKIVAELIRKLKSEGISKIYLSGLSAGAVGAAELAHKFEADLAGVILLFGAHPDIDLTEKPTLLIYGKEDERFPASLIDWVVKERNKKKPGLTSHSLESAGHFHIVKYPQEIISIIKNWLERSSDA